jgi:hypothetical protein
MPLRLCLVTSFATGRGTSFGGGCHGENGGESQNADHREIMGGALDRL